MGWCELGMLSRDNGVNEDDTNWGQKELGRMWIGDDMNWDDGKWTGMLQFGDDVTWGQYELGMMWIEHVLDWGWCELGMMWTRDNMSNGQQPWALQVWWGEPTREGRRHGAAHGHGPTWKPACRALAAHLTGVVKGWEKSAPCKIMNTNYIPA